MAAALTRRTLRELLDYDPETGVLTWRERPREYFPSTQAWKWWNRMFAGTPALTAINKDGALQGTLLGRNVLAHRIIWKWMKGRWPKPMIDHIDGNPANNRWDNLREATAVENGRNRCRNSRNTSGHNGVYVDRRSAQTHYIATIRAGDRLVYLGRFSRMAVAIAARQAAEQQLGFSPRHGRAQNLLPGRGSADRC
jgi:hypothetical protein